MGLSRTENKQLREYLTEYFDLNELKTLSFDLGVDYELFSHNNKNEFGRELLSYCKRLGILNELIVEVLEQRAASSLLPLLAKVPPLGEESIKVQIVVSRDELNNVSDCLSELSKKLNIRQEEIVLIAAAWGSVRLLVKLSKQNYALLKNTQNNNLTFGSYHLVSITDFHSLNGIAQSTWRYIAINHPPVKRRRVLMPSIHWRRAVILARYFHGNHDPLLKEDFNVISNNSNNFKVLGYLAAGIAIIVLLALGYQITGVAIYGINFEQPTNTPYTISRTPYVDTPTSPTSPTYPTSIAGTWEGTYNCLYRGNANVILEISGEERINAVFNFSPNRENTSHPSGSFNMTGTYDSKEGIVMLDATTWNTEPESEYTIGNADTLTTMLDMVAIATESGARIGGRLDPVSGIDVCNIIEVAKVK